MRRTYWSVYPLISVLTLLLSTSALAEIADSSASGFTVKNTVKIEAAPGVVYDKLVNDVGQWWNSDHTFSGDARNLSIEGKAGGMFSEKLKSGGSVRHLTVVYADPGVMLRMEGGLGPFQAMAATGAMTWSLSKADSGTALDLVYTVGGYRPGGMQPLAGIVNTVLHDLLVRLKNYCEHGKP